MNSLARLAPAIFVLLWSTGFVGSKMGAPYIEPMVFLTVRFVTVSTGPDSARAWSFQSPGQQTPMAVFHCIVTGMLVHGIYLGGVFWAIKQGMPAGLSSIIVGLQPVLTARNGGWPPERDHLAESTGSPWRSGLPVLLWCLGPNSISSGSGITAITVGVVFIAVAAISFGTVYQKRFVQQTDLLAATVWQYVGALIVTVPFSLAESWQITWSGELIFAMAWLVLVLSVGAVSAVDAADPRGGRVQSRKSLFYLVPVATAIESYFLFGETLTAHSDRQAWALVIGAVLTIRKAG